MSDHWWRDLPTRQGMYLIEAAELTRRYGEPHRSYHNWQHIERCLIALYEMRRALERPEMEAAEIALLFHDAIYVPGAQDSMNERLSATLAERHVAPLGVPALLDAVTTAIGATARYGELQAPTSRVTQAVMSCDLIGLADEWPDFRETTEAVIHEFTLPRDKGGAGYTREQVIAGRREFWRKLLRAGPIYKLPEFETKYGATAARNIAREMAELT